MLFGGLSAVGSYQTSRNPKDFWLLLGKYWNPGRGDCPEHSLLPAIIGFQNTRFSRTYHWDNAATLLDSVYCINLLYCAIKHLPPVHRNITKLHTFYSTHNSFLLHYGTIDWLFSIPRIVQTYNYSCTFSNCFHGICFLGNFILNSRRESLHYIYIYIFTHE